MCSHLNFQCISRAGPQFYNVFWCPDCGAWGHSPQCNGDIPAYWTLPKISKERNE